MNYNKQNKMVKLPQKPMPPIKPLPQQTDQWAQSLVDNLNRNVTQQ